MDRYDIVKGKKSIEPIRKNSIKLNGIKRVILGNEIEKISDFNNLSFMTSSNNQAELIEKSKKLRIGINKNICRGKVEATITETAGSFEDFSEVNANGTDEAWLSSFEKLTGDDFREPIEQRIVDTSISNLQKKTLSITLCDNDSYFRVTGYMGEEFFTHKGLFKISADDSLTTLQENWAVSPRITIPPSSTDLNIRSKGEVEVLIYKDKMPKWVEVGQIQLFKFDRPEKLEEDDQDYYKETLDSGAAYPANLLNQRMTVTEL